MQHTDVGDLAQNGALPTWFLYQNVENVVLTEVPKLMVDASELVLTPV